MRRILAAGPASESLDRLTRLAAELLDAPRAQVSLIADQQFVWSLHGDEVDRTAGTPVEDSMCTVTLRAGEPLLVCDAPADVRVSDLPPVTTGAVGAYLGVPLVGQGRMVLGALCVYDGRPRDWSERDASLLAALAESVVAELELRALSAEATTAAARLSLALEASGVGSFDLDVGSGRLVWDDRLMRLFGYEADTFDGTYASFAQRVHPEDRERVAEAVRHALDARGDFSAEYRVVRGPRDVRWVEARGRVLGLPGRERLLGVAYDSTELRDARDRLSRTLETMTDAFFALDREWRFTYVNRRAEQLLGRGRDELLGQVVWQEFPEAVGTPFERHYRHAVEFDEPVSFEGDYPGLGVFEATAWPNPDGLAVYFREISARRAVEEARERATAEREQAVVERERAYATASAANTRLALLGEASLRMSESLEPQEVLEALTSLIVPQLGQALVVVLTADTWEAFKGQEPPGDDQRLHVAHVQHAFPSETERLRSAVGVLPLSTRDDVGVGRAVRTRSAEWLPQVPDEALVELAPDEEALAALRALNVGSALSVPLVDRNRVLGAVTVTEPSPEPADLDLLASLCARAAVALDNALLFAAQQRTAEVLQRSLLPRRMPAVAGVTTAVRYLPGSTGASVGGDWYQGVRVGEDLLVAMGDVMGHGMRSAARMGQLRAVVATLALEGLGPAALLERLARLVDDSDDLLDLELATLLVAVLSPDGRLRVASAGHPPPLLAAPGQPPAYLPVQPGPPIGTLPLPLEEVEVHVPRGSTLLLFTDGLVERRDEALDAGLERLRGALEGEARPPELAADHVLEALGRERGGDDDVALLVLAWDPPRADA